MFAEAKQLHLDLFDDASRWPRKPYCSDDKTASQIRTLQHALKRPYIQPNPPHLRVWSIYDIDRPAAALAWEDANLPPPTWAAVDRQSTQGHLVWGLSAPVLVESPDMRQAPMRYLCAVEAAFRAKLDADSGYAGLMTKNPSHPLWRVLRGPRMAYDLQELAEWVELPKHLPKRNPEEVGLGRNVAVFDWLRKYAYRQIRHYKGDVRNFVLWQSHLNSKALERNGELRVPLAGNEVWHVAKSVSKWTWNKFDLEASDARFSAVQSFRSKHQAMEDKLRGQQAATVAAAKTRALASENKRASARLMASNGMSQRAIAAELDVSQKTVSNWLRSE